MILPFLTPADADAAAPIVRAHLAAGRLLAYPTETVYGLGSAPEEAPLGALARFKGRPERKPFLLLVTGREMAETWGLVFPPMAAALAREFWPGPLTLVLPGGEKRVPPELRGPEGGIAVRWTPHAATTRLIRAYGDPITSTSANRPGSPPATSAAEIVTQWRSEAAAGKLLILDGGQLTSSAPSTVVDCTAQQPRVIRPGAVASSALREVVADLVCETT